MPRGVVLNFHRELDGSYFEEGIRAVSKRYRIVSLDELHELLSTGKSVNNICHITFDDGELSFYEQVFPVLKKNGWYASLFVSPKIIESGTNFWFQEWESFEEEDFKNFMADHLQVPAKQFAPYTSLSILKYFRIKEIVSIVEQYRSTKKIAKAKPFNMSLPQLLEVDRSGLVTIGAHTQNHPILMNETDEGSCGEITDSIEHLQRLLGHPVDFFAYPNGVVGYDFAQREIDCLKKAGIKLAFSTHIEHLEGMRSIYQVPRMYFATTLGLKRSHPFIQFRLAMGNRWPQLRKKTVQETSLRDNVSKLLKERNILPG